MSNDEDNVLTRYLRDLNAKDRSKSFDEVVDYLVVDKKTRRILALLREEHGITTREEIPPSLPRYEKGAETELERDYFPDYTLRKGGMEVQIFLKQQGSSDGFCLTREELKAYSMVCMNNPKSDAVIIVWTSSPDFSSIKLEPLEIKKMLDEKEDEIYTWEEGETTPFQENVINFFDKELSGWRVPEYKMGARLEEKIDVIAIFNSMLDKVFKRRKRGRRPRLLHRREALKDFSKKDLEKMQKLFEAYIKGQIKAEDIQRRIRNLAQLTK